MRNFAYATGGLTYLEGPMCTESSDPLMLCISCTSCEGYIIAVQQVAGGPEAVDNTDFPTADGLKQRRTVGSPSGGSTPNDRVADLESQLQSVH